MKKAKIKQLDFNGLMKAIEKDKMFQIPKKKKLINCINCKKSSNLEDCENCVLCYDSTNLQNCRRVLNSHFCYHSKKLKKCSNIYYSKKLKNCNNCIGCIVIIALVVKK